MKKPDSNPELAAYKKLILELGYAPPEVEYQRGPGNTICEVIDNRNSEVELDKKVLFND